jgi:hypothetical protein
MMTATSRALALAAIVMLLMGAAPDARAADPAVSRCTSAHEAGQQLKHRAQLRAARKELFRCAQAECPSMVRDELAGVAAPGLRLEALHHLARQLLQAGGDGETTRQGRDVFRAVAQGRDLEGDDRQSVIEIFTEAAGGHLFLQISMGRADEPHAYLPRLFAAESTHLARLEHPQQHRLHLEGKLADLVEEQRPTVGRFEGATVVVHRSGEGAATMSEELARGEIARNRAAVDDGERPGGDARARVDRARHELLADAGLTSDEHTDERSIESRERREEPSHHGRPADHAAERVAGVELTALQRVGVGVDDEGRRADLDLTSEPQHHPLDPLAEVEGAVAAAQIADGDALGDQLRLGHDNVAARGGANDALTVTEPEARRWYRAVAEDAHQGAERARGGRGDVADDGHGGVRRRRGRARHDAPSLAHGPADLGRTISTCRF